MEKASPVRLSDDERLEKHLHSAEAALLRLSKTQGSFDPMVVEALREALHSRVDQAVSRLATTDQMTLFGALKKRAEEMRKLGSGHAETEE